MSPLRTKTTSFRLGLEPLEPRCLLAGLPVISEFLAKAVQSELPDGYDPPRLDNDWIEIYNAGDEPVALSGWYLTDDLAMLTKWRFPDVQQFPQVLLPPDGYLVVFASDDGVPDPEGNLHTNFKLDAGNGEFLALVMPDGETIAHAYEFPPQVDDVSFGIDQATVLSLVSAKADIEYLVPDDAGQLESDWRHADFVDPGGVWRTSTAGNGIGFFVEGNDSGQPLLTDIRSIMYRWNGSAFVRIPFDASTPTVLDQLELDLTYNDGYIAYLNGVEIGRAGAPGHPEWNSTATGKIQDEVVAHEVLDVSQHLGLLREAGNVLAIHGLNATFDDEKFYVRAELRGLRLKEFRLDDQTSFLPTPGRTNRSTAGRLSEQVTFSHPAGPFGSSFELELSVSIPEAQVYYTLDGQSPVVDSDGVQRLGLAYQDDPITIDETTTVKALAYSEAAGGSTIVSSARYVMMTSGLQDFASNLPIIMMDDLSGLAWPQGELTSASVINTTDGQASATAPAEFTGTFAVERIDAPHQRSSYLVQVIAEDGGIEREPLLGMPVGSEWLLDAAASDGTLLRNALVYDWANQIGRYAPRTRYVNLFLNSDDIWDESDYAGVYVLTETVEVDENRVDVAKLDSTDTSEPEITGGYLLKYGDVSGGADMESFVTSHIGKIIQVDPDGSQLTSEQLYWIEEYISEFENVLFSPDFADPDNGYAKYIDLDSWIDYHIIGDLLTRNPTSFVLDAFFHKDRGGKLTMGPVWDFREAMTGATSGLWQDKLSLLSPEHQLRYEVWQRLFQDPEFFQQYVTRWFELRNGPLHLDALLSDIDASATLLRQAEDHDPRALPSEPAQYQLLVDQLRDWITQRVSWVDTLLVDFFVAPPGFDFTMPNVSISSPAGTVFYTLDGSDPRYTDAAGVLEYTGPFSIADTTTVNARVRLGDQWSVLRIDTFTTNEPAGVTNFRITELNYNPYPPEQREMMALPDVNNDDFEYVEVANLEDEKIHLGNVRIVDGVQFVFPPVDLDPGEHAVVVRDEEAFTLRYGGNLRVIGQFDDGRLDNSGELFRVEDAAGRVIHDFSYHDWWHPASDGAGSSLAAVNTCGDYGVSENWLPSESRGGSPGGPEPFQAFLPTPGDSNEDCMFDRRDIVLVLQGAKYLTGLPATFAEGDWNKDGVFDQLDIVMALRTGNYLQGPFASRTPAGDANDRWQGRATGNSNTDTLAEGAKQLPLIRLDPRDVLFAGLADSEDGSPFGEID